MEEERSGGSGCGESSSRVSTSPFVVAGGRQRFAVELRPGETTIVSWKKLAKDAGKVDRPVSAVEPPPSNAHTVLESRLAPGQPAENEVKDAPIASRFGVVIEKIERLYMGKHSSGEEDLNDVPEDDEYDTEDSFIDDTDLDEYFQVDNSGIKHDGFFVNRGKLEHINEPTSLSNQQLKKRRRKDLPKGLSGGDDVRMPNKHVKVGKKAVGSSVPLVGKNSSGPSHVVALPSVHQEAMKFQNQIHSSVNHMKKKSAETKTPLDLSPPLKVSKGDGSLSIPVEKDIVKQKKGMSHPKYRGSKFKDGGEFCDASVVGPHGKSSHAQHKLSNNVSDIDQAQQKEKDGIHERLDLNVSAEIYSMHTMKPPLMQRKEGSSVKSKSTMLEKAIRELEKLVAECMFEFFRDYYEVLAQAFIESGCCQEEAAT